MQAKQTGTQGTHSSSPVPDSEHKLHLWLSNITYLSAIPKNMHSLQAAHNRNVCILVPPWVLRQLI